MIGWYIPYPQGDQNLKRRGESQPQVGYNRGDMTKDVCVLVGGSGGTLANQVLRLGCREGVCVHPLVLDSG